MAPLSHNTEKDDLSANHKLISLSPHDPVSQNRLKNGEPARKSLVFIPFALELVFVVTLVCLPFAAHAGVFSFLAEMISGKPADAALVPQPNLQTMPLLQAAINPDPNPAKGGGDITIVGGSALLPETGPVGTIADVTDEASNGAISVYVVHRGDTLGQIAEMFGVSINTIVWANDISGGVIHEGDKLLILPISGVSHTVVKGDTIQSIANKFKGDATEIAQFNNIAPGSPLTVGQIIIVPDGEGSGPAPSIPGAAPRPTSPLRGTGGPDLGNYYMFPVRDGIITQGLHGYNAVDISSPEKYGTPILAAASGQVIVSKDEGWNGGYGHYVVIQHPNKTQTLYAHLNKNLVIEGQYVTQGQIIGLMGSTGKATGPHVHFEVRGAKNPFGR